MRCYLSCLVLLGACSPSIASSGDDDAATETTATDEATDESPGDGDGDPPPSPKLVGDTCTVEVLWSTRDPTLRPEDFALGGPDEFFMTGRRYLDDESGHLTWRLLAGEIDWSDLLEVDWTHPNDSLGRRVIRRADGSLWVFGSNFLSGRAWIAAYSPSGELLWLNHHVGFEWRDAVEYGEDVLAVARRDASGGAIVHRLDPLGEIVWSFEADTEPRGNPAGLTVVGLETWVVGSTSWDWDCAWRGRWTVDGDYLEEHCPPPVEKRESFLDVLSLVGGEVIAGGYSWAYKSIPLLVSFDPSGETKRWTYGPDFVRVGLIAEMAELPGGGLVAVSGEYKSGLSSGYEHPIIHHFSPELEHLARCELTRAAYPNYEGRLWRVEVGPDGEIFALLREWISDFYEPVPDESELPDDFGKYALIRINLEP